MGDGIERVYLGLGRLPSDYLDIAHKEFYVLHSVLCQHDDTSLDCWLDTMAETGVDVTYDFAEVQAAIYDSAECIREWLAKHPDIWKLLSHHCLMDVRDVGCGLWIAEFDNESMGDYNG